MAWIETSFVSRCLSLHNMSTSIDINCRVSEEDGRLELVTIQSSRGAFPRHFNFDLTGRYLLVGNHASDTVVAFR